MIFGPCLSPRDRTGKHSAVVCARQRKVDQDYHHRAKEFDSSFGGDPGVAPTKRLD